MERGHRSRARRIKTLEGATSSKRNRFICSEQAKLFGVAEGSNAFVRRAYVVGTIGGARLLKLHPIIIVRFDPQIAD